jgi:hypothetical protein
MFIFGSKTVVNLTIDLRSPVSEGGCILTVSSNCSLSVQPLHAILCRQILQNCWFPQGQCILYVEQAVGRFWFVKLILADFQRPRGLRRGSAVIRLLGLWVRIPPVAWMSVSCECCVLSGRGLCDELVPRSEESCRVWCV